MEPNSVLESIYYNPKDPGTYASVNALHRRAKEKGAKIARKSVQEWLADQDAYTLHRHYRKPFKTNPIVIGAIDKQWPADMADMSSLSRHNEGYRYLLTVIDCFSNYAWAIPLKTKSCSCLLEAFKILVAKAHPRKPNRKHTDKAREFVNKLVLIF